MDKKVKLILSLIGLGAVVVPVVLLVTLSSKTPQQPQISTQTRSIDAANVADAAKRAIPSPSPFLEPSPTPATESAVPAEPSPSP